MCGTDRTHHDLYRIDRVDHIDRIDPISVDIGYGVLCRIYEVQIRQNLCSTNGTDHDLDNLDPIPVVMICCGRSVWYVSDRPV